MRGQLRAIFWAQFRTARNLLPRTSFGAVAVWFVSLIWYGIYATAAAVLAITLPAASLSALERFLPVGLLAILLFWQLFPLMTLSGGWSLELNKILVYPIRRRTLFAMEVLLRLTTAPEMILVLIGLAIGLLRRHDLPALPILLLALYLPLNLFLSLAIRGAVRRLLGRKRLKELTVIFLVAISVLPSLIFNTHLGEKLQPSLVAAARFPGTPWSELSSLVLSQEILIAFLLMCIWIAICWWLAQREFALMVSADQTKFQSAGSQRTGHALARESWSSALFRLPDRLFRDPLAALIQKDLCVLSRSPRFRLTFGMACLLSVIVFFPLAYGRARSTVIAQNFLPAMNLYGLLIVGETLLWNAFGFDRRAAQIYFLAPVPLATVFRAKNIVAVATVGVMTVAIATIGSLIRNSYNWSDFAGSVLATAVVTVYFLAVGNFTSVWVPRPINPNQAMKNQNNGKASALLLLCLPVVIFPLGLAYLARWAFSAEWAFLLVLAIDFVAGCIIYQISTENAIQRAQRDREKILSILSKENSLIDT
jgi:ABC-2 type transport system permease protein